MICLLCRLNKVDHSVLLAVFLLGIMASSGTGRGFSKVGAAKRSRQAEKQANEVLNAGSALTDLAFDSEIAYIVTQLKDPSEKELTLTIGALMRNGTLKAVLCGGAGRVADPMKKTRKKLKPSDKRWRNLKLPFLKLCLQKLEPNLFSDELCAKLEATDEAEVRKWLCFALNCTVDGLLPLTEYPQAIYTDTLVDLIEARYKELGRRLAGWGAGLVSKKGYFTKGRKSDGTAILKSSLHPAAEAAFPFNDDKFDSATIDDEFSQKAVICTSAPRRRADIMEEFWTSDPALIWPCEDELWQLSGVVREVITEVDDASSAPSSPAGAVVKSAFASSASSSATSTPSGVLSSAMLAILAGPNAGASQPTHVPAPSS